MARDPRPLVSLRNIGVRAGDRISFAGTDWDVCEGQQWAIVGPNGSGKSLLASALAGRLPLAQGSITYWLRGEEVEAHDLGGSYARRGQVVLISLAEQQNLTTRYAGYHQARWNSSDANDGPTVEDLLTRHSLCAINPFEVLPQTMEQPLFEERRQKAIELMELGQLLRRRIKQLSNGEFRRLLIARAVALRPRLLVLDDPFAGLDGVGRERLRFVVDELTRETTVVLATARPDDLPASTTHILDVDAGQVVAKRKAGRDTAARPSHHCVQRIASREAGAPNRELLVEMKGVTIKYGDAIILNDISFSLARGEHCALLGPNGAGKSTLLSLLLADNPQAYANDIRLFGRPRGSGESIWDIKSRIGWVAPELLLHYPPAWSCLDVVLSGLFSSVGLFAQPTAEEESRAHSVLAWIGLDSLAKAPMRELSHGNQRIVLLARALVGKAEILVLDEPCQGLDPSHTAMVNDVVDRAAQERLASTIFVTHHEEDLPTCITRFVRLREGRIVP